ncbi:hypothetical protein GWK47_038272 [Chionoecetes opilio]|uniref:Uncharacterized protein n=1 Tax=Chionoecetes opilio TaxID=41210 RepID=A0A8J5CM69_CHIOP|nr:hypothetical protein GWK47_038272 [Chionoecetes opilio]
MSAILQWNIRGVLQLGRETGHCHQRVDPVVKLLQEKMVGQEGVSARQVYPMYTHHLQQVLAFSEWLVALPSSRMSPLCSSRCQSPLRLNRSYHLHKDHTTPAEYPSATLALFPRRACSRGESGLYAARSPSSPLQGAIQSRPTSEELKNNLPQSFLTNRVLRVRVGNILSSEHMLPGGIPQAAFKCSSVRCGHQWLLLMYARGDFLGTYGEQFCLGLWGADGPTASLALGESVGGLPVSRTAVPVTRTSLTFGGRWPERRKHNHDQRVLPRPICPSHCSDPSLCSPSTSCPDHIIRSSTGVTSTTDGYSLLEMPTVTHGHRDHCSCRTSSRYTPTASLALPGLLVSESPTISTLSLLSSPDRRGRRWSSERLRTFQEPTRRTLRRFIPEVIRRAGAASAPPRPPHKKNIG